MNVDDKVRENIRAYENSITEERRMEAAAADARRKKCIAAQDLMRVLRGAGLANKPVIYRDQVYELQDTPTTEPDQLSVTPFTGRIV